MKSDPVEKLRLIFAALILGLFAVLGISSAVSLIKAGKVKEMLKAGDERDAFITDVLPGTSAFVLPSALLNSALDRRYYPDNRYLIRDDGQIVMGSEAPIDPETNADNIASLRDLCAEEGKDFLYVMCPGKPQSDDEMRQYGIDCYRNENADSLLAALEERGVPVLDLRPLMAEICEGDLYRIFSRTDHHWNGDGGLIAARLIAEDLNERYGAGLDVTALDEDRLTRTVIEEPWVGEMGEKILGPFSPRKDHLIVWTPKDPVPFHMTDAESGIDGDGGFELFLHEESRPGSDMPWGGSSYYYFMGGNHQLVKAENRDRSEGDLLIIKDSFSCVVVPYLSLTSKSLTTWDMRRDKAVMSYIKDHPEIRTVLVMYTISISTKSDMNAFE